MYYTYHLSSYNCLCQLVSGRHSSDFRCWKSVLQPAQARKDEGEISWAPITSDTRHSELQRGPELWNTNGRPFVVGEVGDLILDACARRQMRTRIGFPFWQCQYMWETRWETIGGNAAPMIINGWNDAGANQQRQVGKGTFRVVLNIFAKFHMPF